MSVATTVLSPTPPAWSQADAIAFEAARECLTDVMAIVSAELAVPGLTAERERELSAEFVRLHEERARLAVGDRERVAAIRSAYGKQVRDFRASRSGGKHGY